MLRNRALSLCAVATLVVLLVLPQGTAFAHASVASGQPATYGAHRAFCIPNPNGSGCASQCQLHPSHTNCDGKDPENTHCADDGTTVNGGGAGTGIWENGREIAILDMRWSPTCQSNWTRMRVFTSATYVWAELENNHDANGSSLGINCGPQNSGAVCYTPLYYAATESVMSCGNLNDMIPGHDIGTAFWNPGWVDQFGHTNDWTCP